MTEIDFTQFWRMEIRDQGATMICCGEGFVQVGGTAGLLLYPHMLGSFSNQALPGVL